MKKTHVFFMGVVFCCGVAVVQANDYMAGIIEQMVEPSFGPISLQSPAAAVRPCSDNGDCPGARSYCAKMSGDCDGLGQCQRRPQACTAIYDPVCGCDGATYSNACVAAMAGVNVAYDGECAVAVCFDNSDCGALNQYCAKAPGDCEGAGTCQPVPEACYLLWDPVCGCDGATYSNACFAAMAGVSVDYAGECGGGGGGCQSNAECGWREYCAKPVGDCDGVGECQTRPEICLDVWIPVCGCDGNIYSNDCYAARVGMNVATEGPCPY